MTSVKKFLFIGLICTAVPTFCMDVSEVHVLEDGQEWKLPQVSKDLEDFDGRMIAVKLRSSDSGKEGGAPPFAWISSYEWKPGHRTYIAHWCVDGHQPWRHGSYAIFLTPTGLGVKPYFMRRLMLSEARYLARGIAKKDLLFYTELNGRMKIEPSFKLSDLNPKEQLRYMREHYYQDGELRPLIDDEVAQHGDLLLDMSEPGKSCVVQ
jgi:hypothetical protein